jgi:hypothetical protein
LAGFLFLAMVLDVWSRKVVGWAMATRLRTELMLAALEMAITQRRPEGVIHHSDQGSQYTSVTFGNRCKKLGVRISMGSVGDAYDNAMAESFFATLECELLNRRHFRTPVEAEPEVFSWIEAWYNPTRLHSSIGYLSPNEFERRHAEEVLPASGRAEIVDPGATCRVSLTRRGQRKRGLRPRTPGTRGGESSRARAQQPSGSARKRGTVHGTQVGPRRRRSASRIRRSAWRSAIW